MTDRPFTTPQYQSTTDDVGLGDPTLESHTAADTFAEAQVAASPTESSMDPWGTRDSMTATGSMTATDATGSTNTTSEKARETAATAKDEAKSVALDAKEGGRHVAETAKSDVKDVAAETRQQARHLYRQLRTEVTDQAATQNQRAASGLRSLADELGQMVGAAQQPGLASDVARQASDRARGFADWLEQREPGDILNETRDFARRRPGTFLAAAAAIGFLGGRLTRGLADDDDSPAGYSTTARQSGTQSFTSTTPTYGGEPYAAEAAATEGFGTSSPTLTDSERVDAGIDPATYTHPDPTRSPADPIDDVPGATGFGQEQR